MDLLRLRPTHSQPSLAGNFKRWSLKLNTKARLSLFSNILFPVFKILVDWTKDGGWFQLQKWVEIFGGVIFKN